MSDERHDIENIENIDDGEYILRLPLMCDSNITSGAFVPSKRIGYTAVMEENCVGWACKFAYFPEGRVEKLDLVVNQNHDNRR